VELDRFLNLFAASLGALGSVYVLKSYLAMTASIAAAIATPRWGFSLPILDSLSSQRAESIVGATAFILALAVGVIGIAFAPSRVVFPSRATGFIVDLIATGLMLTLLSLIAGVLRRRHNLAARKMMLANAFDDIVVKRRFESAFLESLTQSADALLGIRFPPDTSPVDIVRSVGRTIDRDVPDDILKALAAPTAT
jgi:hypothetical protein